MLQRQLEVFEEAATFTERALRNHSAKLRQLSRATMLFTETACQEGAPRPGCVTTGLLRESECLAPPLTSDTPHLHVPATQSPDRISVNAAAAGTLELATKVHLQQVKEEMIGLVRNSVQEVQQQVSELRRALEEEVSARLASVERLRFAAGGAAKDLKELRGALRQSGVVHRGCGAGCLPIGATSRALAPQRAIGSHDRWSHDFGVFDDTGADAFANWVTTLWTSKELLKRICRGVGSALEHMVFCRAVALRENTPADVDDGSYATALQDLQRQQANFDRFEHEARRRFDAGERRWDGLLALFGESRTRVMGTGTPIPMPTAGTSDEAMPYTGGNSSALAPAPP